MIAEKDKYTLFLEARSRGSNPFKQESVISATEVWGKVMTDLPSLNQHIDETIACAIDQVKHQRDSAIGIAIKGDRGTGKSHVINRVWHNICKDKIALFSYIPPCMNPAEIDSHVRFNICRDFQKVDNQGITQWQKLAAFLIGELKHSSAHQKYQNLIERSGQPDDLRDYIIQNVRSLDYATFFDDLTEAILEKYNSLDFDFLKATLFTLFKNRKIAQVALAWLRGEDHPSIRDAGLPTCTKQQQAQREIQVISQISKLAEIVSMPIVICFDQLDAVGTDPNSGDSKAQSIARCIDRIYFQCSNVILLCCVISDTWREIEQMGGGTRDRVGQWIVSTKPPTPDQMRELIRLRLLCFYEYSNLEISDYPDFYPFNRDELDQKLESLAGEAAGARSLFSNWCARKFEEDLASPTPLHGGEKNEKIDSKNFLEIYEEVVKKIRIPSQVMDEEIASVLYTSVQMLVGHTIANVRILDVTQISCNCSLDLHWLVSGHEVIFDQPVRIGVRVCETQNGNSFNAVMRRLLDYEKYNLTRGCLVRSTSIPMNWRRGKELATQLTQCQSGEVVVLKKEHIRPLLAIEQIHNQAADYGLTAEEVCKFVRDLRLIENNPLIDEILSAPEAA